VAVNSQINLKTQGNAKETRFDTYYWAWHSTRKSSKSCLTSIKV